MAFNPIKNHPINDYVKRLLALRESAILFGPDNGLDEQHKWYLERIFYMASLASKRLKSRKMFEFNLNAMNNLVGSAESIINELNYFIANRNPAHIQGAFNQAEQGFQLYLEQATPRPDKGDATELEVIIDNLRAAYATSIDDLKIGRDNIKLNIDELNQKIAQNLQTIQEIDKIVSDKSAKIDAALDGISGSFDIKMNEFSQVFDKKLLEFSGNQDSFFNESEAKIDNLIDLISKKEIEARAIVESVGVILTTGTYQLRAQKETELSNLFRWITIGLFSVGIAIVLSNFAMHLIGLWQGNDFTETPWTIATRFLTALVVALPALYTARESARHRSNADQATQRQLELSTLGPFIELMPIDIKNSIREKLTEKYFGNSVEPHKVDSPLDTDSWAKIIESIMKNTKAN